MNELIKKITAPNGGVFTGNGTNTYLLGKEDLTLIDPGPKIEEHIDEICLLYTSPSPRDGEESRMPSSA